MPLKELLRAQLHSVRSDLTETYPHLTDDLLPWAPAEGMRTVQGQFVELISTERSITDRLRGVASGNPDEEDAPLWAANTVGELVKMLNETRALTLQLLDQTTEQELHNAVKVSAGFAEYLGLETVTAAALFSFIARHESYHAGQLVSYLWSRGDNPYDWD
jgi:uncharacterized damage-inducible protein DinB